MRQGAPMLSLGVKEDAESTRYGRNSQRRPSPLDWGGVQWRSRSRQFRLKCSWISTLNKYEEYVGVPEAHERRKLHAFAWVCGLWLWNFPMEGRWIAMQSPLADANPQWKATNFHPPRLSWTDVEFNCMSMQLEGNPMGNRPLWYWWEKRSDVVMIWESRAVGFKARTWTRLVCARGAVST